MTSIVVRMKDGIVLTIEAPQNGFDELNLLTELNRKKYIHIWGHYIATDIIAYVYYK